MKSGGLLARLNASTRQWHADVDGPWLDLLRPTAGRADYLAQLVRSYGFVAPFEAACRYTPGLSAEVAIHDLWRAGLIARDLLAMELTPAQVASIDHCHSITTFAGVPEALGWLYMLERATLLHDSLRQRLVAHIPDIAHACTYLAAGNGNATERWHKFGRTIDRIGAKPQDATAIMAGAHAAFSCAMSWFRNTVEARRSTG